MWELILDWFRKKTCIHDWEEIKSVSTFETDTDKRPYKRTYLYLCKKCGEFKQITMQ